jgi:hypothetical protein
VKQEDERSESFDSGDKLRPLKIKLERFQAEEELSLPQELGGVSSEVLPKAARYILQFQASLNRQWDSNQHSIAAVQHEPRNTLVSYITTTQFGQTQASNSCF